MQFITPKNSLDYDGLGIEPPEHIEHPILEEIKVRSEWRQEGNFIIREGDEMKYAVRIPVNKILVGTDENGKPILKNIDM